MAYRLGNRILKIDNKLFYASGVISSPADIPNLRAWYGDYVNGGTLRTTLSNDAAVNQWDDLSGNNFHMNQKAGQPKYKTSGNYIDLTGAQIYNKNHAVITGNGARTCFSIAEAGVLAGQNNENFILGTYSATRYWMHRFSGLNMNFQNYSTLITLTPPTEPLVNTKYVMVSAHPSTGTTLQNLIVRLNGYGTYTHNGVDSVVNTNVGIHGGGSYTYGSGTRGTVHASEIIVYNRFLSMAEIYKVEAYLRKKYNITFY